MRKNNRGQEAIEFILICVLVFFGGLFAIMTFGGKMAAFFTTDSSFAQVANQKANVISATSTPDFNTNLTTTVENENRTTVATYEAMKNPDGSVSVDINGQVVNLTPEDLNLVDTVFETSGSDGIELINAIAKMVEIGAVKGDTGIPLEISFGSGSRSYDDGETSSTYKGTASVNTIAVKSGDDVIIIQKDQACVNPSGNACNYLGTYTIEGTINSNNTFSSSKVAVVLDNGSKATGTYNGNVNINNGLKLNGNFVIDTNSTITYDWNIDFSTLKAI